MVYNLLGFRNFDFWPYGHLAVWPYGHCDFDFLTFAEAR